MRGFLAHLPHVGRVGRSSCEPAAFAGMVPVMKRTFWVIAVFAATVARATSMLALDVSGLTQASDLIVRGTIVSVAAHWSGDHARIFTDAEVHVTQVWKGPPSTKAITVMQPGGEIDDVGQRIHGVATFRAGDDVVLFLEKRGPRYTVTGMAQGKFLVEPSADGTLIARTSHDADLALVDPVTRQYTARPPLSMPLDELKTQVRAALPRVPLEPTNPRLPTVTP